MKNILVVGSSNLDITAYTPKFPQNGETVSGRSMSISVGGKGANQATAAARAGGTVAFISKIGNDSMSDMILKSFKNDGINTDFVYISKTCETGSAFIEVNDITGDNRIVCIAGANATLTKEEMQAAEACFKKADIMLVQLELETDRVTEAIKTAKKYNVPVILNPAPAKKLSNDIYSYIDYFTPNESEAAFYTGFSVNNDSDAEKAADVLLKKGIKNVIITMGKKGCFIKNSKYCKKIMPFNVKAVDTTGAGDSFNGGLAVALANNEDILTAIEFASATAALSVTKEGTSKAMPFKSEIDYFLKNSSLI